MGKICKSMAAILIPLLLAQPAIAGGLDDVPPYDDPCLVLPSEWDYKASVIGMDPETAWQSHIVLVRARCGDPLPLFKVLGWTDEQILRSAFNGHEVPKPPAPVPVPAAGLFLLSALMALGWFKARR